jgi:hypothetical protein
MFSFAKYTNRKILIIFFFLTFFTNSYAETVSTDEVLVSEEDSRKTITEDLTITSTGRIHCEDIAICIVGDGDNLTIINHGTISNDDTDGDDLDILIKGNNDAFDMKIYNYGMISVDGNSAIFVPNNDDNDGDGVGAYIYNEGTIESGRKLTIRYHSSDYTKIDNYGTITTDNTAGQALHGYDDTFTTINNYSGATISAPNGTGAIQTKINSSTASTSLTINNWGTITSKNDTIQLGISSTLNNYGSLINTTLNDAAVKMQGDNNTINLYDGTILEGYLEASTFSGSTLNLHLCSSYYFKTTETWTVNDKSGCGELVYSGGYAQAASPLFQSVADEIGVLRTDLINDIYDVAKDKMENDESFGLPLKSYTKREKGKSINKFASNANGFAFGFPSESDKIKGHLVFNILNNNVDLLNQNIKDETYQVGFFLENLNAKVVFGYHDYNGDRTRLNNTVSGGKETIQQDHKSFSSIIGTNFSKKLNNNSYIKYNLDTNFEGFFNHEEGDHVKWQSRILGQVMGDVTYGWSTLPKNKFKFNPELTLGYRTIIHGKNQKYTFNGNKKNFDGGVKEDFNAKLSLKTNYSFNKNTNLFLNTSAKKTNSKQETYSLNIGFKSIF